MAEGMVLPSCCRGVGKQEGGFVLRSVIKLPLRLPVYDGCCRSRSWMPQDRGEQLSDPKSFPPLGTHPSVVEDEEVHP